MSILDTFKTKAKQNLKHILLPEGTEERTVQAASIIAREKIAEITLLGKEDEVKKVADKFGVSLEGVHILDHLTSPDFQSYADKFYELRKEKGVTPEKAIATMKNPLFFAAMMIHEGAGDGMVAGAVCTTGDTLRPGLQIIKMAPGISVVSSCFVMEIPKKQYGENGLMLFADCAVNPCPTAEQLAAIAITTAKTGRDLCGFEPRVAMLSFSTKGSAEHDLVTKVREATRIAHGLAPDLVLDGELQLDAALVPEVGALKAPGSSVAGRANVLIFPDLQSGNIGYKITQRLGGVNCFAVLQGLAMPCNDLSRGCSVEDIVNTVAMTAVQAQ